MPFSSKLICLGNNIYIKQVKKKVPYMDIYVNEVEKKLILRKKINGRLRQCVLGVFPTVRIEDALKKSIEIGQEWLNQESKPKSYTFSDLFELMLNEKRYNTKSKTIENYQKRFRSKAFDSLRNKPIDLVEIADIWTVIDQYSGMYESAKHYYRSDTFKRGYKVAEWWFSFIENLCKKNNIDLFSIFEGVEDDK